MKHLSKKHVVLVCLTCMLLLGVIPLWRYVTRPTVSVVMSTYNRESLLPRAIESILSQTFTDFEFIIINDGSADSTSEILENYARQDKRIKIITNRPNQGLIASLNKGLDMARGKYIARMDDDDISLPKRFEKQVKYLDEHPEITVLGTQISPPGSMTPYNFQREPDPDINAIQLYLGSVPLSHPSIMVRRDFLNKYHIRYREAYKAAEDRPFYGEIITNGGKMSVYPEVLLKYYIHPDKYASYEYEQNVSKRRFHYEMINRFFEYKDGRDPFSRCLLLPKLIEANRTKKLLNQQKLEQIWEKDCRLDFPVVEYFHHPSWEGYVGLSDHLCKRQEAGSCQVLKKTPTSYTIKWDGYGIETFEKAADGKYYLKQETK